MDTLKKIFPFSFKEKKDVAALVINILIHIVVGVVIYFVLNIIGKIPVVGIITGLVGALIELYLTAGVVISCLDYFKVLK